jgi:glycosyltransferase involved in cell wall biosynthesis
MKSSSMLLFFDFNNDNYKGILTGKLFEYLASGRPILSFGIINDASKMIEKANAGVNVNETNLIEKLNYYYKLYEKDKTLGFKHNWEYINQFSRENQTKKLAKLIEEVIE